MDSHKQRILGAALMLTAAALHAQDEPRTRAVGSVVTQDGKPWVGATVVLFAKHPLWSAGERDGDRVVVQTDKRGRFRAQLLARPYSVWAFEATDDGARFAPLVRGVYAGKAIKLVEAASPLVAVQLHVIGLVNWKKIELFHVHNSGFGTRVELDEEGRGSLAAALGQGTLQFEHGGVRVQMQAVQVTHALRAKEHARRKQALAKGLPGSPVPGLPDVAKQPLPPAGVERVLLSPPLRQPVLVAASGSGKPAAGVEVACKNPRVRATTDGDGRAELLLARRVDEWGRDSKRFRVEIVATGPGLAIGVGGWSARRKTRSLALFDPTKVRDGRAPEIEIGLGRGFAVEGRVALAGLPGDRLRVVCRQYAFYRVEGDFISADRGVRVLNPDREGRFRVHGLASEGNNVTLFLYLDGAVRRALAPEGTRLPAPRFLRLQTKSLYNLRADVKLGTIDLAKLRSIDLEVRTAEGQPAAYAEVTPIAPRDDGQSFTSGVNGSVRTDRRGRCRFWTFDRSPAVAVLGTDSHLLGKIDPANPRVTLKPYAKLAGRVVDASGKPIAGARLSIRTGSVSSAMWSNVAWILNNRLLTGRSAADGRFTRSFIPVPGLEIGIGASKTVDGRNIQSGNVIEVRAESVEDAELMIPLPDGKVPDGKVS